MCCSFILAVVVYIYSKFFAQPIGTMISRGFPVNYAFKPSWMLTSLTATPPHTHTLLKFHSRAPELSHHRSSNRTVFLRVATGARSNLRRTWCARSMLLVIRGFQSQLNKTSPWCIIANILFFVMALLQLRWTSTTMLPAPARSPCSSRLRSRTRSSRASCRSPPSRGPPRSR